MKRKRALSIVLPSILLLAAIMACGLQETTTQADADLMVTQTLEALATLSANVLQGGGGEDTPASATPELPPEPDEPTPTPSSTPTVVHLTMPSSPAGTSRWMTDRSSEALAGERRANADNFNTNLLERPFSAEVMDYKAYLDIVRAELYLGSPWMYVTIFLEGSPPSDVPVDYAVEIDLDLDGRGDWLIMGPIPPSSDWSTDGVVACRDANHDVGGPTPMRSDAPNPARDGYEDCVFQSGLGPDPDAAWIRRDPGNSDRAQLAFKFSLIGSDSEFLWGAWSDEGAKEPGWFDYHDHFTIAEAGSPASESSHYPLKALALMDNTCRWSYGFEPTGTEPGVCYIPPTPTPIPLGSIAGMAYEDWAPFGSYQSGEAGLPGATITLGQGACNSSGYGSSVTGSSGTFFFGDLLAGTYCVKSSYPKSCGGYTDTTATSQTVTIGPGEDRTGIFFGYARYIC